MYHALFYCPLKKERVKLAPILQAKHSDWCQLTTELQSKDVTVPLMCPCCGAEDFLSPLPKQSWSNLNSASVWPDTAYTVFLSVNCNRLVWYSQRQNNQVRSETSPQWSVPSYPRASGGSLAQVLRKRDLLPELCILLLHVGPQALRSLSSPSPTWHVRTTLY